MNDKLDVKTRLLEIISQILVIPKIDPDKTFFDLGGSSMDAMTLVHEVNSEFGVNIPLQILFEASTLEEFSCGVIALIADRNSGAYDQGTSTISI
jgi:acyl carrier protein